MFLLGVLYEVQRYGIELNLIYEKFFIVLTKTSFKRIDKKKEGC